MVKTYNDLQPGEDLNLIQRLLLLWRGCVFTGYVKKPSWRRALPRYVLRCECDGLVVVYPQGPNQLRCPICSKETVGVR